MTPEPIRVLIVDDDPFVRRTAAQFVASASDMACVAACGNGAEAVSFVAHHAVDVVLMDVRMPTMDGVEAAARILTMRPGLRVLMWTSFENDEAVATAMARGAAGFLLKTCTAQALVNAIRAAHGGIDVMSPGTIRALQTPARASRSDGGRTPTSAASPTREDVPTLTPREQEVLSALSDGLSNSEIATLLFISESSVKAHLTSLMRKMGVNSRVRLVLRAHKLGLVR